MGEIILDQIAKKNEKVFHLLRVDQYIRLTYHQAVRWYREIEHKTTKIIQSSYLIDTTG